MVVLAAVAHLARRDLVDVAVFSGTAVLMLVLPAYERRVGRRPGPSPHLAGAAAHATSLLAGVLVAVLVLVEPRDGPWVRAAFGLVGVVVLVLAVRAGPGSPAVAREGRVWPWVVVLLLGCLVELANFLAQTDPQTGNPDHPTLSVLLDPVLVDPWSRALLAAGWLWAGWRLGASLLSREVRS